MNRDIKKDLRLSLKTKWFEMTKEGVKPEDYRSITPYWAKRFFVCHENQLSNEITDLEIEALCEELSNAINCLGEIEEEVLFVMDNYYLKFKPFETNTMTLGYPKSTDTERIIKFEHVGIESRARQTVLCN